MDKRKRIKRLAFYFICGFIALFIFRLVYGYVATDTQNSGSYDYISDFFDGNSEMKRNYASDKYENTTTTKEYVKSENQESSPGIQHIMGEQKFEKIASMQTRTEQFEKDEKTVRDNVTKYHALIQYEHNEGNAPYRQVHFSIGVPPAQFDSMITDIKKVGKLLGIQVTKTDKTNEYRKINAQKASLEKTRDNLIELKKKEGKIDEYMNLTNRILEIEQQLQELGVELGDFDTENEFCTVRLTLAEREKYEAPTISIMHRVKVAMEWTIKYYFFFMLIITFINVSAFCMIWLYDRIMPMINKRKKE